MLLLKQLILAHKFGKESVMAGRENLRALLPCINCGKGIETNVFELPLPKEVVKTVCYWTNKDSTGELVTCPHCGCRQEIVLQATVRKR
jgi:hypothetical protein